MLERRIARWARRALDLGSDPDRVRSEQQRARALVGKVVSELARIGAVSDAAFAEGRARALSRGGRSGRAIAAHLASRGIDSDAASKALQEVRGGMGGNEADIELAAALMAARKRRIGPFSTDPDPGDAEALRVARRRALGALARAGFAQDVAEQALDHDLETAEALIARLREG